MKAQGTKPSGERGFILLLTLGVLLILTTLGAVAISDTTTELRFTGRAKAQNTVFYAADGGSRTYVPILRETIQGRAVPSRFIYPQGPVRNPANLLSEILGITPNDGMADDPESSSDLSFELNPARVDVDLDRVQERILSGGAAEFAGGYEGIGVSAAGGNVGIYYKADSLGRLGTSQSKITQVYIYHVR
jgi:hypothetical protein